MRKTNIVLTILLFCSFSIWGQTKEVKTLIKEGMALHDQKEYKKAIDKYQQVLKKEPNFAQALYEMSLSYLQLKDYRNASKYSTMVLNSINRNISVGAYAIKSEALVEMGNPDDAIILLQEGLKKNGDAYLLHFNLALNYYKKKEVDNALTHVQKAIDMEKNNSGAFLLYAYLLNDKNLWVQSILAYQMFLLLEPDSGRAKNAFEDMLQTMRVKALSDKPVERSFIQQQLLRGKKEEIPHPSQIPPLSIEQGLNRNFVYHAITSTLDSLKKENPNVDIYTSFKEVNKAIISVLEKENNGDKEGVFWNFYVPFFSCIAHSDYYDTFTRYISVSYFPESFEWWKNNKKEAEKFITWFEKGDKDIK